MNSQYEVLNPWAEADPVPLRGISPRLTDLKGKTIGLFAFFKCASEPILKVVQERLKEKFPTAKFSPFHWGYNLDVIETEHKAKFEDWVKGVDAAIAAVGD